jgi:uncharacterized protein YbaP (TraB family)
MIKAIAHLENIDQQLNLLDKSCLLALLSLIENLQSAHHNVAVFGDLLQNYESLPKAMKQAVNDSIMAKIKG